MKAEVAVLGSTVPNKPRGFCGREATLNRVDRSSRAAAKQGSTSCDATADRLARCLHFSVAWGVIALLSAATVLSSATGSPQTQCHQSLP